VGAHHPQRYSNTHAFHLRGWRGINIDPLPGFKAAFDRERPNDINLNLGIAEQAGELTYTLFNDPALNTFDTELARSREGVNGFRIVDTKVVPVLPLREVFDKHLLSGTTIGFLSVDVEGFDLQVLRSNDWNRYRPEVVVSELDGADIVGDFSSSPIAAYLKEVGYRPMSKLFRSVIFVDKTFSVKVL
jgi:FkbM family methyltransferase